LRKTRARGHRSGQYTMNKQPIGTVFLEWKRNRCNVARLFLQKYNEQDVLHLRIFYLDAKGELKPTLRGVTIPFDQIGPLRKALKKVNEKFEPESESARFTKKTPPKRTKKFKLWRKHATSKE
jgi:hypothetical protein